MSSDISNDKTNGRIKFMISSSIVASASNGSGWNNGDVSGSTTGEVCDISFNNSKSFLTLEFSGGYKLYVDLN